MPVGDGRSHRPGTSATGHEQRLKALLAFAKDIQRHLNARQNDLLDDDALLKNIQDNIQDLRTARLEAYGHRELDNLGTELWNTCTRLKRENNDHTEEATAHKALLLSMRVFSFQLLDAARWSKNETTATQLFQLLKPALKVGRSCINEGAFEHALLILQRATDHQKRLAEIVQSSEQEDTVECKRLEAECLVLRVALAWRENRHDIAEHVYQKAETLKDSLDPQSAEYLADVLFEIGKAASEREDYEMAVKWLERSYDIIDRQNLQDLSRDALELRLSVSQATVTALLGLDTPLAFDKAQRVVEYLETEMGNHSLVLLLRLELLNKSPEGSFDGEAFCGILRRMVKSFGFVEPQYELLRHHIQKLHDKCPRLGCQILDEFLVKLMGYENRSWVEKLVIMRMWMTTSQRDSLDSIEEAQQVFQRMTEPLSAEATTAAQTLAWKKIESHYSTGEFDLALKWCKLSLCRAFDSAEPLNRAKIERKLLLCTLSQNDLDSARAVFYSMPEATQQEPASRFLLFKVAIRSGDQELASECLDRISVPTTNPEYLYACVLEAQQANNTPCTIAALKRLADGCEFRRPGSVHLPALLRCMIRVSSPLLTKSAGGDYGLVMDSMCEAFERGRCKGLFKLTAKGNAKAHKKPVVEGISRQVIDSQGNRLFDIHELEWFSRNAYNIAVRQLSDWDARHIVRILNACIGIIEHFPSDLPSETAGDLALKALFCHFLAASALVTLARSQDNREKQVDDYLKMRHHVAAFDIQMQAHGEELDSMVVKDLSSKQSLLFMFDFEGAIQLNEWTELVEIIRKATACKSLVTFQGMADCLLRSHAPLKELNSAMRALIDEIWSLEGFTAAKLAKYVRCLFQAILPRGDDLAFELLGKAVAMAGEAFEAGHPMAREDTEWIAASAYNHAIEWYHGGDNTSCTRWAERAMMLARYCDDDGQFEAMLHKKYTSLKLDA